MTGKTHVALGTAFMIAMTVKYPQGTEVLGMSVIPAVSLLTISAGSYGPDIDIKQSHLGKKYKFLSKHLKHRGITHTLLVPAVLLAAMIAVQAIPVLPSLIFGFLMGWVTHILADLCNRKGVPLLWPLSSNKIHIATFKTGTWHEAIFAILWLGGLIAWLTLF